MRRSNWRWVQSGGSESTIAWKSSASGTTDRLRQRLENQEDVEGDDQPGDERGDDRRDAQVDEVAHHLAVARQLDERHECERDPEREHDLREHERACRVEPD